MKHSTFLIFQVLLAIILIGKVLNLIFRLGDEINSALTAGLFCLLGLGYIVEGLTWNKISIKCIYILCGLFLIVMNFIPMGNVAYFIGSVCILIPLLIARFYSKMHEEKLQKHDAA